ncbi:MAG: apolipoprotein N-acyltransferase [Actinomycetota bacterium]
MLPYLAALVSALLMWAAFPPLDIGPLAFVAPIPLLWALRRVERGYEAISIGFLWGSIFFGILLNWIAVLGFIAWVPLVLLMASYFALYGFLVWLFRLWPAWRWWLIAVGAWVGIEFLRARFPFGGFPWGNIGYAAAGTTPFLGAVQWIGPSGWMILAVAFGAAGVLVIESREHWRPIVDTSVVILLIGVVGGLFPPRADGEQLRVAIVQGGSPCPMVHCQNENQRIFEQHIMWTQTIPEGGADLVVWAENSTGTPYDPEGNESVSAAIIEEAGRIDAYFLVSGTRRVEPNGFLNVNMLYSPQGVKIGEYAKQHPVPFGEYVPLRSLLGFIPQLDQVPRDMVRGTEPVVFPMTLDDTQSNLGSVISFEGAFTRSIRAVADIGSQLMVVATNESSYGDAPASDQFVDMTRVNAAAIGQDLVHAAITGRSTFITAAGAVGETTGLYEETVLYGDVAMRSAGPTLFTRYPNWTMLLALVGVLAALFWPGEGGLEYIVGRRKPD